MTHVLSASTSASSSLCYLSLPRCWVQLSWMLLALLAQLLFQCHSAPDLASYHVGQDALELALPHAGTTPFLRHQPASRDEEEVHELKRLAEICMSYCANRPAGLLFGMAGFVREPSGLYRLTRALPLIQKSLLYALCCPSQTVCERFWYGCTDEQHWQSTAGRPACQREILCP